MAIRHRAFPSIITGMDGEANAKIQHATHERCSILNCYTRYLEIQAYGGPVMVTWTMDFDGWAQYTEYGREILAAKHRSIF